MKRITGDTFAMNSGKGVILDSGTTDTYLHISMEKPFSDAWKKITGKAYTNNPIKLSRGDLLKLPTILIQMMVRLSGHSDYFDIQYQPWDVPSYYALFIVYFFLTHSSNAKLCIGV